MPQNDEIEESEKKSHKRSRKQKKEKIDINEEQPDEKYLGKKTK